MRTAIAIVLLLLLGLPSGLPLWAAVRGDAEAGLPACCRRMGQHHCAMRRADAASVDAAASADAPAFVAGAQGDATRREALEREAVTLRPAALVCPMQGALVVRSHVDPVVLVAASQRFYAAVVAHPAVQAQTACRWRVARERARGMRGPPVLG